MIRYAENAGPLCCRGSRAGYKEQVVLKPQAARLPLQRDHLGAKEPTIFSTPKRLASRGERLSRAGSGEQGATPSVQEKLRLPRSTGHRAAGPTMALALIRHS